MTNSIKYIGLDVHKETIAISVAESAGGEARYYGEIANRPEEIQRLIKRLRKGDAALQFCYEAGSCGYEIYHQLTDLGWECHVVAPSLIPRKAGDRVKTDRRDSLTLTRLFRAGELTAVWVPDDEQEALRDLTRAREDLKHLQRQARQRLLSFMLRHGKRYEGKTNWTQAHYRFLETIKFRHELQQIVFEEYVDTLKGIDKRVKAMDKQLRLSAERSVFWPVIEALMAMRGLNLLTATTVIAEIGDLQRFESAPQLMAYLGLVPSEHSSGGTRRRGAITKTGNGHVRRVLVEAAWTYRHPARKTAVLQRRAERTSEEVQEIAWEAQKRLCGRYRHLEARGKLRVQVCTAIARELVGFIWAVGQAMPRPAM